jgi:hypothetical protein
MNNKGYLVFCFFSLIFAFFVLTQSILVTARTQLHLEAPKEGRVIKGYVSDYPLPWPGILPDNPFYFLKEIRDKVWLIFIRNPEQKTKWLLLMADKRLYAAGLLQKKKKESLTLRTLTQAEFYLQKAIQESTKTGDSQLASRLLKACLVHQIIIKELANQAFAGKQDLQTLLDKTQSFCKRLEVKDKTK